MSVVKTVLIGLTAATMVVLVYGQTDIEMTDDCLGCLCDASTRCNKAMGCHSVNLKVCGPFLISKPYWNEAGKPVLNERDDPYAENAFNDCVHDYTCSVKTIRNYMAKYGKDCNGDGVIDCDDFARLHKFGYTDCSKPYEPIFNSRFSYCINNAIFY
nr:lysozyme-like isoform X1 [Procambarus clarkii]XP_045609373.1 lysozyme-like isoform X2 [Procambarus clarkii]XP_045609374.1 lysozyme-like isoform X3 [Procambarus clarkii]XP_045609375.1 lysozyme-like isoform X3 [Procambarus clarkii]